MSGAGLLNMRDVARVDGKEVVFFRPYNERMYLLIGDYTACEYATR